MKRVTKRRNMKIKDKEEKKEEEGEVVSEGKDMYGETEEMRRRDR